MITENYIPVNVIGGGHGYCKVGEICNLIPTETISQHPINITLIVVSSMLFLGFIYVTIKIGKKGGKTQCIHA